MLIRIQRQSGVLKAEFAVTTQRTWVSAAIGAFARLFVGLMMLVPPASAQGISLNDEIIADPISGAALLGFDPVAYFIEQRAVPGTRERQTVFGGKVWYFHSNANRSAFEANPQTFLPAFGGHDPVAIAAGFALAGSPEFFAIADNRVYLFRHAESRDAFLRDATISEAATLNWPQVKRDMVP